MGDDTKWREWPPTPKQIALCERLMDLGATMQDLNEFHQSIDAADRFIKRWGHLLARERHLIEMSNRNRPESWGGVPNC